MAVHKPTKLILRHTYKNEQLQAPGEKNNVWIRGMGISSSGDVLILADWDNYSVKTFDLASGSLSLLYKEIEQEWRVSNAALINGNKSLLVTQTKQSSYSKRILAAQREESTGQFRQTDKFSYNDNTSVRIYLYINLRHNIYELKFGLLMPENQ